MRFRLALALGKTLGEIGQMSQVEFLAWWEYYQIEPWGSHFDDLRAGQVAAVVANVHRDSKRKPTPFGPLDYAPWNNAAIVSKQDAEHGAHSDDAGAAAQAIKAQFARMGRRDDST